VFYFYSLMSLLLQLLEKKLRASPETTWHVLSQETMSLYDQYRIQCAALIAYIRASEEQTPEIIQAIKDTLEAAKLIETLFAHQNEIDAQRGFTEDVHFLQAHLNHTNPSNIPGMVQYITYEGDTLRLYLGHLRRIGLGLLAAPEAFGRPPYLMTWFVQSFGPILAYASLLIYLPRTVVNTVSILRQLSRDSAIDLNARWRAHLEIDDRLFLIINDLPSIIAACIGFFLLSGPTLALAVYITAAVKFTEILLAIGKAWMDISRLYAIRDAYEALIIHNKKNDIFITAFDDMHMTSLNAYIEHEKEKLHINAIMHTLLLPCLMVFIPFIMTIHPWLPIIAAIAAIALVCIRLPNFRNLLIADPPEAKLQALNNHRFFQPMASQTSILEIHTTDLTTQDAPGQIKIN
jgi:hypothetical protein